MKISCKLLNNKAKLPTKAHLTDAGFDLYSTEDVFIEVGQTKKISTGIALSIPAGYYGLIADRSSMGSSGLKVMGGIVDTAYIGELAVFLSNLTNGNDNETVLMRKGKQIRTGDRVAQIIIHSIPDVSLTETEELQESGRGYSGLGSSGQ